MNVQKRLLSVAIGCLLLGVTSPAMAVDCADRVIAFTTVPEIVINGQPCVVFQVVVEGRVEVTNSPAFEMTLTDVGGPVTITNTGDQVVEETATILRVDILQGDLTVTGHPVAIVAGNTVQSGNLVVNNNLTAVVARNAVNGNIECTGNPELDAAGNRATGTVNCTPQ